MEEKGRRLKSFIGIICFVAFGVISLMDINYPDNPVNLSVGIILGLLFSFISKKLFSSMLSMFNGKLKNTHGKGVIKAKVSSGMVYMLPFAIMAFASAYYLGWTANSAFLSSAIMTCGALTGVEIGKLKEKPAIADTIVTSASAAVLSAVWIMSAGFLRLMPGYVVAIIKMVPALINQFKT